ncbi:MAG: hypothetical protein ACTHMW_10035 [Actinomycetes bacterium]
MSAHAVIYGDFSCPWSYLASQRAALLEDCGLLDIDWRAVEHDARAPVSGRPTGPDLPSHKHELAAVASLVLPGEHLPADVPAVLPHTKAAVSAYAEALTDGIARPLRERLFEAVWRDGRSISAAGDVRRLVTDLVWPRPDREATRMSDLPQPVDRDPDMQRVTRRMGGAVACDGQPLTTEGWRRVASWRQAWEALGCPAVPALVTPEGDVLTEAAALEWLGRLGVGCPTWPLRQPHRGIAAGPPAPEPASAAASLPVTV